MSSAPFDYERAFALLKARLDRAGLPIPIAQEEEWRLMLTAAVAELRGKGIKLTGEEDDIWLAAETAKQKIQHRDAPGGYSEELRRAIVQRFMKEGLKDADE